MPMWKCNNCGERFEDPKEVEEEMGEAWGQPAYYTWYVCPYCESGNYGECDSDEDEEN